MNKKEIKNSNQKRKKQKIFISLAFILLIICIAAAFVYKILDSEHESISKNALNINNESKLLSKKDHVKNFVVYGTDDGGENSRSDSIMIVSVNQKYQKIKIISIARDTYVKIPELGISTKINHAYAYGGYELAISTLNQSFNLDIEDFVTINFRQFKEIIDKIGGIDVQVSEAEFDEMNRLLESDKITSFNGGNLHLNGTQALAYARERKQDSDNARTSRQRTIMKKVYDKIREKPMVEYPSLLSELLPLVKTSFSATEIISLAKPALSTSYTIETAAFPNDSIEHKGGKIDGIWYYVYDLDTASKMIYDFIYNDIPISSQEKTEGTLNHAVEELNASTPAPAPEKDTENAQPQEYSEPITENKETDIYNSEPAKEELSDDISLDTIPDEVIEDGSIFDNTDNADFADDTEESMPENEIIEEDISESIEEDSDNTEYNDNESN